MIKERPILFTGAMVRALLDGSKTQTRRAMKTQMLYGDICGLFPSWYLPTGPDSGTLWPNGKEAILATCPHGQPGDRLWVREAWRTIRQMDAFPPRTLGGGAPLHFEADGPHAPVVYGKLRPGMFMCRWMSRTLLEITSIRVERLQDISDEDALAEGVDRTNTSIPGYAKERYRKLWETINGPGSWALNPWVWAITFRRLG